MAQNSKTKSTKKRVKVQDLNTTEKKMSAKEMKKVKGGLPAVQKTADGSVRIGDGSVRTASEQFDSKIIGS
jgi:hypothetical protein